MESKMNYTNMRPEVVQGIQDWIADETATLLAEGNDGRDIAQAIVEAIAIFTISSTNDQAEANKLATHMVMVAQELASKINRPSTATIMNGH
jgi:hypothetical protein